MNEHLRTVDIDGYRLDLWDTNTRDRLGKSILGYRLRAPSGEVVFEAKDFACSPLHAVDSDKTIRDLLGFLTLRPGDTDDEYFADYNARQLAFAEDEAEALALFGFDWEDGQVRSGGGTRLSQTDTCRLCGGNRMMNNNVDAERLLDVARQCSAVIRAIDAAGAAIDAAKVIIEAAANAAGAAGLDAAGLDSRGNPDEIRAAAVAIGQAAIASFRP